MRRQVCNNATYPLFSPDVIGKEAHFTYKGEISMKGLGIHPLTKKDLLTFGLMMFSIYFGAGNLIFAPVLGQAAGENTFVAMLGFMTTGIGLPLLGITAIALCGGDYAPLFRKRTSPWFAAALLVLLYLIIGPLFAMPRSGAVSFEIGIRPFLAPDDIALGQLVYTAIFFSAAHYLALTPSKIVDRVGKILTPALLVVLLILFLRTFQMPLGDILPATGNYIDAPFAQGFQDGYQTMDLLASIGIGVRGVSDTRAIGLTCLCSGLMTVVLMTAVYGSLAYLGATSAAVLGHSENGGQLLSNAVGIFFGAGGNLLLAVIIGLACLTTTCGINSSAAMYFNRLFDGRITYERLLLLFNLVSFAISNIGLTQIIAITIPFLIAIYPLVIVFVIISLFDFYTGRRKAIYQCAVGFTLVFSVIDGLRVAGINSTALDTMLAAYLPFYDITMGWVCPALVGALVGFVVSHFQTTPAET